MTLHVGKNNKTYSYKNLIQKTWINLRYLFEQKKISCSSPGEMLFFSAFFQDIQGNFLKFNLHVSKLIKLGLCFYRDGEIFGVTYQLPFLEFNIILLGFKKINRLIDKKFNDAYLVFGLYIDQRGASLYDSFLFANMPQQSIEIDIQSCLKMIFNSISYKRVVAFDPIRIAIPLPEGTYYANAERHVKEEVRSGFSAKLKEETWFVTLDSEIPSVEYYSEQFGTFIQSPYLPLNSFKIQAKDQYELVGNIITFIYKRREACKIKSDIVLPTTNDYFKHKRKEKIIT